MDVFVAGGTGFVGRVLCRELDDRGHTVTAASRSPDPSVLPESVRTATLDVTEPDLTTHVEGFDAVVNLVALPSHVQPRGRSHDDVHRQGTQHLVEACEEAGVRRFVQMSGLGVETDVRTAYFEAKRAAERIVRDANLEWVIYRPSVVFGDDCAFLPFVERLTAARIVPLPSGRGTRIQPMWVGDLAPMLADGVEDDRHVGECYALGGPETLTMAEVVRLVEPSAVVVSIPTVLARVAFTAAELLPGVPFGRDQYRVQHLDNTVSDDDVTVFDVSPSELRSLGEYLDGRAP